MLYYSLAPDAAKLLVKEDGEDPGAGTLEGYASVFGNADHGGDIVVKGAFKKTLKEGLRNGAIKLYDSHMIYSGTESIIGVVTKAEEDDYGLKFEAKFSSVQRAQEIRTKIKEGILNALSFGYDVLKYLDDESTKTRKLLELKLYEVSVVPWGMNPKALIEGVKGFSPEENREEHFKKATRFYFNSKGEIVDTPELPETAPVVDPPVEKTPEELTKLLEEMKTAAGEMSRKTLLQEMRDFAKLSVL